MTDKIPPWLIAVVAVLAIGAASFFIWRGTAGPQLPSNYDPNAPIGTQITPPAGFKMPKDEPAPPPPPPGVSMSPPMPGNAGAQPPGPR